MTLLLFFFCLILQLRNSVKERFDRLRQALEIREKILLRQVDVLAGHQACRHMMIENIEFLAENEFDMLKRLTSFGKFSIKHFQIKDDASCLGVEEYIPSIDDHHEEKKSLEHYPGSDYHHCVTVSEPLKLPKCVSENMAEEMHLGYSKHRHYPETSSLPGGHQPLNSEKNIHVSINETGCNKPMTTHHHEKSFIDLTTTTNSSENNRHKYVKICEVGNNTNGKSKRNKQITIRTTTQTSTQTEPHHHPPTPASSHHVHHVPTNGSVGHSMHDKSKVLKNISNLTMSSSNGTINMKNISNLTINSSCNKLKTNNDHNNCHTENLNGMPCTAETPECGFYDRLITENKNLQYHLMNNAFGGKKVCTPPMASLEHIHLDTTTTPVCIETNTIISANNETPSSHNHHLHQTEHPVQVQQWLKQIIYETETEPVINAEFMEFINLQR